jgi:hypothetical protein
MTISELLDRLHFYGLSAVGFMLYICILTGHVRAMWRKAYILSVYREGIL